jgi:Ca-activated chloride channel family protein
MVEHNELRALINAYYDGEITAADKDQLEKHLAICPDCREYRKQLENISASLRIWQDEDVSWDLEKKIKNQVVRGKPYLVPGVSRTPNQTPFQQRFPYMAVSTAMLCLVILSVSFHVYQDYGRDRITRDHFSQEQTEQGLEQKKTKESIPADIPPGSGEAEQVLQRQSVTALDALQKQNRKNIPEQEEDESVLRDRRVTHSMDKKDEPSANPVDASRAMLKDQDKNVTLPEQTVAVAPSYLQKGSSISQNKETAQASLENLSLSNVSRLEEKVKSKQIVPPPETHQPFSTSTTPKEELAASAYRTQTSGGQVVSPSIEIREAVPYRQGVLNDHQRMDQKGDRSLRSEPASPYSRDGRRYISDDQATLGYGLKGQAVYHEPQPSLKPIRLENETEQYDPVTEQSFVSPVDNPLSTFSIDVDTAAYSNIRRFLTEGRKPPRDAIRIEEMINYFVYDYPQPQGEEPFSMTLEANTCPWNTEHTLVMIGLKGQELASEEMPSSNLVFLIDVSGSMNDSNKLPLLKSAFRMLVNQLRPQERISIVTYAGSAGVVLPTTPGSQKDTILAAIDRLQAGGSTAGEQGIRLAYRIAQDNFLRDGNNRVILATDGDFNVGVTNDSELVGLIEQKREEGVFLSVLGFGSGNYQDAKMEKLADKGNGNYAYIDNLNEAQKVLTRELGSMLFTIAKDVKIQVEFNPAYVKAYRLIGYANRMLAKEDFHDDAKDAGELGAGHSVTAFYEIIPADSRQELPVVSDLRYQQTMLKESPDFLTVKLRYKKPQASHSELLTQSLTLQEMRPRQTSVNFLFASSVAEFGLLLSDSPYKANASYQRVMDRAQSALGEDREGYRREFLQLIEKARLLE